MILGLLVVRQQSDEPPVAALPTATVTHRLVPESSSVAVSKAETPWPDARPKGSRGAAAVSLKSVGESHPIRWLDPLPRVTVAVPAIQPDRPLIPLQIETAPLRIAPLAIGPIARPGPTTPFGA
jgi:hypothetical protein